MSSKGSSLSACMRRATRRAHAASDALVNVKLGLALSDDGVWAQGLLVFYEIFRRLEEAMLNHRDSLLGELYLPDLLNRAAAFESDLEHYLGADWKRDYVPRPAVADYLSHLEILEKEDLYLLTAYFYHLYMGLLSGGQVLSGKRALLRKVSLQKEDDQNEAAPKGEAVTYFGGRSVASLKKEFRAAADRMGEEFDPETREKVVAEGVRVFQLNNAVIASVRGVDQIFYSKLVCLLLVLAVVIVLVAFFVYKA